MTPNSKIQGLPVVRGDLSWTVHQQAGKNWYSVLDPINGRWFRMGNREYAIASRLDKGLHPKEIVDKLGQQDAVSMEEDRLAVTEQDVLQVAQWLARSQLVESQTPRNVAASQTAWTFSPLYMRIPLIQGYRLQSVLKPIVHWIGPLLVGSMLASCLLALMIVVSHWSLFAETTSKLFVSDAALWWMLAWLVLKVAHELAHAAAAIKVKSEIRSAGICFIFLAPVPYVDASDLWSLSNRWHRIACSGAGILVELALASVAVFVAVLTNDDSVRYFCCALVTMGTVSTLAFNANPLMRFDGYFILSDLINRPNLWTQANLASKLLIKKLFQPINHLKDTWPNFGLALYGLACTFYRISMLVSIAATAILLWESIGVVIVIWGVYALFLQPWLKQRQLRSSTNQVLPGRSRFHWVGTVGMVGLLLALLFLLPSPIQPSAPGVVNYYRPTMLHSEAQGTLEELSTQVGSRVQPGDVLAVLKNPELQLELRRLEVDILHAQESVRLQKARGALALVQSESARLDSLMTQLDQLKTRVDRLAVRAPHAGVVVAMPIANEIGKKIEIGDSLCLLAHSLDLEVSVSATQRDAQAFRNAIGQQTRVHIYGGPQVQGIIEMVDPKGSDYLSEPLLAANYSGPIQVELNSDTDDPNQFRLLSPRFQVCVRLPVNSTAIPGQMASLSVPGNRKSLFTAVCQWCIHRWTSLQERIGQDS